MDVNELKGIISRKLEIPISDIGREDFREYGVRFHYLGSSYRATTDLAVEKVEGGCLVTDDDARRIEKLLRTEEWDGEGLPPVGLNVEAFFIKDDAPVWYSFVAKYIGEENVVALVGMEELTYTKHELSSSEVKFRPIRSEADKKRAEAAKGLIEYLDKETDIDNVFYIQDVIGFYDAIAAGKIPHIRID